MPPLEQLAVVFRQDSSGLAQSVGLLYSSRLAAAPHLDSCGPYLGSEDDLFGHLSGPHLQEEARSACWVLAEAALGEEY